MMRFCKDRMVSDRLANARYHRSQLQSERKARPIGFRFDDTLTGDSDGE
jgi:hypothetical protein